MDLHVGCFRAPYYSARGFRHVNRIKILSPETVRRKPPEGKKGHEVSL
jgi:hypothetical protein